MFLKFYFKQIITIQFNLGGKTSHILQEASFPVVSNEECSEGHGLPIPESLICTGAESGDKGACNVRVYSKCWIIIFLKLPK